MKQNDVFTKRDTQRVVNNLTCHESQHSSAMYIYKMKEITAIYKQQETILKEELTILKDKLDNQTEDILSEIFPQIQKMKQDLQDEISEYKSFNNNSQMQLKEIRDNDLDAEQEYIQLEKRLKLTNERLGDQLLQKRYDIKLS